MTFRIQPAMLKIAAAAWLLGATSAMADTTLEFTQWWEPELPAGSLRAIMNDFETANPGIKVTLVSGPYATTRDQISVGAATGTLSDVVGLDGAWVNNLNAQGALADMNPMMDASEVRQDPGRGHHQGGRQGGDVSRGFVRLSGLRQPGPRRPGRRDQAAVDPRGVSRSRQEDDACRQEPVWLGAAPVAANAVRCPERPDVVGLGLGSIDDGGRQAGSRGQAGRRYAHLRQIAERRRRHLARHLPPRPSRKRSRNSSTTGSE